MSRHLLVLSLLIIAAFAATADDWQFIGPKNFGARVTSLAVDQKKPTMFLPARRVAGLGRRGARARAGATSTLAFKSRSRAGEVRQA